MKIALTGFSDGCGFSHGLEGSHFVVTSATSLNLLRGLINDKPARPKKVWKTSGLSSGRWPTLSILWPITQVVFQVPTCLTHDWLRNAKTRGHSAARLHANSSRRVWTVHEAYGSQQLVCLMLLSSWLQLFLAMSNVPLHVRCGLCRCVRTLCTFFNNVQIGFETVKFC